MWVWAPRWALLALGTNNFNNACENIVRGKSELAFCLGKEYVEHRNLVPRQSCHELIFHEYSLLHILKFHWIKERTFRIAMASMFSEWFTCNTYRKPFYFPFFVPALFKQFQPHTDTINSIQLFTRSERLLVLTASSDCAVALWDIEGRHIGIFGQVN